MASHQRNYFKILVVGEQRAGKTSLIKMIHNWHKFADKLAQPADLVMEKYDDIKNIDDYQAKLLARMSQKHDTDDLPDKCGIDNG